MIFTVQSVCCSGTKSATAKMTKLGPLTTAALQWFSIHFEVEKALNKDEPFTYSGITVFGIFLLLEINCCWT